MIMPVAREVMPFLGGCLGLFGLLGIAFRLAGKKRTAFFFYCVAVVSACYMLYFFRDPERISPDDPDAIVAGADGVVMAVKDVYESEFLGAESVRVSIFLSLLDVHVNRSPLAGSVRHLAYIPGKRHFTFTEKSSESNHHSVIVIDGARTSCVVKQIVGPVARRVVYWLEPGQRLDAGERIGMMKFGSRLDMYFPRSDVELTVKQGDHVSAGVTVIGRVIRTQSGGSLRPEDSSRQDFGAESNTGESP